MIKPLTSLRFVFALMVFLQHSIIINDSAQSATFESVYNIFFRGGDVGVSFFFILSGFILSYSYQEKLLRREVSKKQFWLARAARLYPLYLLTSLLAVPQYKADILSAAAGVKLVANFLLLQAWFPDLLYLNIPGWSISAEMFFYLVFPFLVGFFFRKRANKKVIYSIMLLLPLVMVLLNNVVPADWEHFLFYRSPLVRITDFFLGIGLYQLYKSIDLSRLSPKTASLMEIAALLLFVAVYACRDQVEQNFRYSVYCWLPMCSIILIFTNPAGILSRFLSHRFFVYLGELSFGFYLFHVLVFINFLALNRRFFHLSNVSLIMALVFAITLLISWVSFEKLEKPANAYLRKKFK